MIMTNNTNNNHRDHGIQLMTEAEINNMIISIHHLNKTNMIKEEEMANIIINTIIMIKAITTTIRIIIESNMMIETIDNMMILEEIIIAIEIIILHHHIQIIQMMIEEDTINKLVVIDIAVEMINSIMTITVIVIIVVDMTIQEEEEEINGEIVIINMMEVEINTDNTTIASNNDMIPEIREINIMTIEDTMITTEEARMTMIDMVEEIIEIIRISNTTKDTKIILESINRISTDNKVINQDSNIIHHK